MTRAFLAIVAVIGLASAAAAIPDDAKDLQGQWIQSQLAVLEAPPGLWQVIYGHELSLEDPAILFKDRSVVSFKDDQISFKNGEHGKTVKFEYDSAKEPKTIDFVVDGETRFLGVYAIKEGKLHLAIGHGKDRPKEVEAPHDAEDQGKIVRIVYSELKPPG